MSALWVEVIDTRGSAPRDAGTAMRVTAAQINGTIGGGALEHQAIGKARRMLSRGETARTETLPLGPNLGQCCGGAVTLRYSDEPGLADDATVEALPYDGARAQARKLWVWGAGHVGRAVVQTCPPAAFDITWIDSAPERFPAHIPDHARMVPSVDMSLLATRAPRDAHHLIFTYSHDIDLALCGALLKRGAGSIGLIGSDTKWARFRKRLRLAGLDPTPIICPIGDKTLGKAPRQIAFGTVAALLSQTKAEAL